MKKSAILAVLILGLVGALAAVPASAESTLYDNTGPASYATNGFGVSSSQALSDSFTLGLNSTVTGATVALWDLPGKPVTSIDWAISTSPFAGDLSSGTATSLPFTFDTSLSGYNIDNVSFGIPSISLPAGTYWLQLANAVPTTTYWDESNGLSSAEIAFGGVDSGSWAYYGYGSETFQILGTPDSSVTPEPSSFLLLGSGLAGLAGLIKRKLMA
jgi:hypothetical protein